MTRPKTLWIPGTPIAQPRAKATAINGKARVYTPSRRVKPFKDAVRLEARREFRKPIDGPVRLELIFYFPRPASRTWKTKPMPREWHIKKPDFDNLEKAVADALNGIAWRDDCQVCESITRKYIASGGEGVGTRVMIETLDTELASAVPVSFYIEEEDAEASK